MFASNETIAKAKLEPGWIGRPLRRIEDDRLLRGRGRFVDDLNLPGCLSLVFLRSEVASGEIRHLDVSKAAGVEGVVAVFVGADTEKLGHAMVNPLLPNIRPTAFPLLARRKIESVGQIVVAVAASNTNAALDALEQVTLEVDARPLRDQGPYDQVIDYDYVTNDVPSQFAKADHVVTASMEHSRLAPAPMEPRVAVAQWNDADERLTVWLATQTPHRSRQDLARILHLDLEKIRVVAPDVGGAFGGKASIYPEDVITAWTSIQLRRPVKWCATRSEDFVSATQGRGASIDGEMAVTSDGQVLALKAQLAFPLGFWLPYSAAAPARNASRILPGPYAVQELSIQLSAFLSNTAPMNIYRGAGRPEAALLMERLMDRAAETCGLDPVEIRRRNLVPPSAMPHKTATGEILDSGNYPELLASACRQADYAGLRSRQRSMRSKGRIFGVGVALYIEPCGQGWESASIGLAANGRIVACTGATAQGQGRETAFAQIVADTLGVHVDDVVIRHGDTDATPPGIGALASRSTAIGGSALLKAAQAFQAESRRAAAKLLGCEIEMILPGADGFFGMICGRTVTWQALAASGPTLEHGLKLTQSVVLHAESEAWSSGCCVASVSIDRDTGDLTIETFIWVDDAGRIINPMLVKGQLLGGLAQGLGEALMEQLVYDAEGQLVTGSFMDYAMPRASDIPAVQLGKMETPTNANPLGAKGVGEAGCIGVPACLLNAVLDALAPFGVQEIGMPMTSQKIWQALNKKSHHEGACKS